MFRLFVRGAVIAALLGAATCALAAGQSPQGFMVFDGLLYRNKPDLAPLGMPRILQINQPSGSADKLDEASVRARLATLHDFTGALFLDYEDWPTSGVAADVGARNIAFYNRVTEIAREMAPKATIGYYGEFPCRNYWGPVSGDHKKIADWKECNRRGEPVASRVDVVYPSLYTFYNDQKSWDIYARAMIEEARRYRKPVYVFLWPEFHVSNPLLRNTEIPRQFWRHQLDFCRGLADGVVIWGGWNEEWREDAPWWIETKAFLAANRH
jgi:hypothetical protein